MLNHDIDSMGRLIKNEISESDSSTSQLLSSNSRSISKPIGIDTSLNRLLISDNLDDGISNR